MAPNWPQFGGRADQSFQREPTQRRPWQKPINRMLILYIIRIDSNVQLCRYVL